MTDTKTVYDEPSDDPGNVRFNYLVDNLRALWREFQDAVKLMPDLTEDGCCAHCGEADALRIEEPGYVRFTDLELIRDTDGQFWHATTNGWDDYSEDGQFESVLCLCCFTRHKKPDDISY